MLDAIAEARGNVGRVVGPLGELGRSRLQARVALGMALCLVPLGCHAQNPAAGYHRPDPDTIRYRLLLRENPVDPGEAFRCYGACQPEPTPRGYLDCLAACPGFEITPQEYCSPSEVPPVAACFTVRKIPAKTEPPVGLVVLAVVGSFLLVIGAESLCASSKSQCGNATIPPPH